MDHQQIIRNIIAIFLLVLPGLAYGDQESTSTLVREIVHAQNVNIADISPEQRSELIPALKQILASNSDSYPTYPIYNTLLALDDEQTIATIVDQYHTGNGGSALWIYGNEGIIPYVASDMFNGSTEGHWRGDVFNYSIRDSSTILVGTCIQRSKAFPPETRAWADHLLHSNLSTAEIRAALQQWWLHNKAAILAKRYQDATWLPPQDDTSADHSPSSTATQIENPQTKSSHELTPAQSANETEIPFWIYGIIILSVGAIIGFWYFLRPQR